MGWFGFGKKKRLTRERALELLGETFPKVDGEDFSALDLSGARITQMSGAEGLLMAHVNLGGAHLTQCHFKKADLRSAMLHGVDATQCSFAGADLTGAVLDGGTFSQCSFEGARLEHVSFAGAEFTQCRFVGTVWAGRKASELAGAKFIQCSGIESDVLAF